MSWWLTALISLSPVALILIAMVVFRRTAAFAGVLGLLLTVVLSLTLFDFPALAAHATPRVAGLIGSFVEATFTAATILWIIFGALCVHQLQLRTGAIESLRAGVGSLSDDPRIVAILIAWFFALFIEGAAGFGTPIALAAPFLVGFGFRPVQAVTIVLIGHSVGVSFGAVGTPIMPQIAATDFTGPQIARATGEFHLILGAVMLAVVLLLVTRQAREDDRDLVPIAGYFVLAAAAFLLPMAAISRWIGPELPTMGGALVGGALFIAALNFRRGKDLTKAVDDADASEQMPLLRAAAPYLIVIGLILLTRLIGPIQTLFQSILFEWELHDTFQGRFQPFYHPGTILVLGALFGARIQGASRAVIKDALKEALKMLGPVTIALIAMLAISRLMVHTAMIDALAEAAARTAGGFWPAVAPVVGVLGTFVTGSATASNILFTDFQVATADRLGLDELRLVAAQGFGAAVGNIICPHNVIAGCATVGIAGREGEVLRRTLGACAIYVILGGLLAWVFIALTF